MSTRKELNLWNISNEYQNLFAQLYDPETGEINEEIQAQIDALEPSVENKCIAVASWIRKMEKEKRELDFFKTELAEREDAYDKSIEKWENYLMSNMERCAMTEVRSPYFTIKLKKNPYSTEILDESLIPEKFMSKKVVMKQEIKPDKNAIKEEVLRTGIQIAGTYVSQKTKLEISIDKI